MRPGNRPPLGLLAALVLIVPRDFGSSFLRLRAPLRLRVSVRQHSSYIQQAWLVEHGQRGDGARRRTSHGCSDRGARAVATVPCFRREVDGHGEVAHLE